MTDKGFEPFWTKKVQGYNIYRLKIPFSHAATNSKSDYVEFTLLPKLMARIQAIAYLY